MFTPRSNQICADEISQIRQQNFTKNIPKIKYYFSDFTKDKNQMKMKIRREYKIPRIL